MGNYLQRGSRRQQDTRSTPWNLRLQNAKQRTSRCLGHHIGEECFCLRWKKIRTFKARQDSQKENEGLTSVPMQDGAKQTCPEELCYILINHRALRRRPSGTPAEQYYENIPCRAERPRESLGGTETEYSLLYLPSTPRNPPSPENEYELLMPCRVPAHAQTQPRPLTAPAGTQFSRSR